MKIAAVPAVSLIALAGVANASIISYTTGYSQNFNSLPTAASSGAVGGGWVNDSTLPGWFSNQTSLFRVDNGGSNTGALNSYGAFSNTERALGSAAGGSSGAGTGTAFNGVTYAAALSNDNGSDFSSFTVTYDGEQWRNGGNAAAQTLVFSYQFFAAGTSNAAIAAALTGSGWTNVSALNFTTPVTGTSASALDGNAAANRTAGITATITQNWAAGSILVVRWTDANDAGNDHGIAIDNLDISAVPTPGAAALMGLGALAMGRRRRA